MKNISLSFFLLCSVCSVYAQPNITNYNWVIGTHRYFYTESAVNPNPVTPGNNVTWDFTSLTSDPADSVNFQLSGSTPFTSDFPSANIVWAEYRKLEDRTILWHFYKDQFSFDFLGYGEVGMGTSIYSSGKRMLKFPMAFESTFTDYYTAGNSYKSDVKYDGYGTLKLPGATYTNVFRTTSKDSSSPSNIVYYYEWFDLDRRILFIKKNNNFSTTYYLKTANKTEVNPIQNNPGVLLYPNPCSGSFHIEIPQGTVHSAIKVFDATGQLILQEQGKDSYSNLNISQAGYYVVEIAIDGRLYYKKLLITM